MIAYPSRRLFRSPAWLLALVLLAPFLPILLHPAGRVLGSPRGDNPDMFYFINAFAGACWRSGSIPLWNPYILLGQPFLGEGQAALFHPLSWLFIALPTGAALNWIIALSFLLTGLAFYGYLRSLSLAKDAAFCGALVWSFSSVLAARIHAGHLTNLLIFFELPLMLMLWERHRQTGALRPLLGLALTYGLMILAAHPQFLYIFSLFFLCYVLLQSAAAASAGRAAAREEGKAIARLGCFVLLGVGLGAVQLLPTSDFTAQSFRTQASLEFCGSFSFPPENLLTLAAPRFFGFGDAEGFGQYWGRGNFNEMAGYLGILPLILAASGFFAVPRRRRFALAGCALLFTLFALGANTPLFPLIFRFVPGFSLFRGPSKSFHIVLLCLATFSAYGIEGFLHPGGAPAERKRLRGAALAAAALLALTLFLFAYYIPGHTTPGSHWRALMGFTAAVDPDQIPDEDVALAARWTSRELLRALLFILLAGGALALAWRGKLRPRARLPLVLGLTLADLLCLFLPLFAQRYDEAITRRPPELDAALQASPYPPRVLAPQLPPNASMVYGFSSPSGYVGAPLERYNTFINALHDLPPEAPEVSAQVTAYSPELRFLAFDAQLLPPEQAPAAAPALARIAGGALVRQPEPFPRAFLAATPHACADEQEAVQYILKAGPALVASPAVEPGALALPPAAPLAADEQVRITAFSPNRVELEAKAAQPRVLVLAEAYERNWKAVVNGQPAPVFPANSLFRGVIVPEGTSRVVFVYQSAAFHLGAAISLFALFDALALGWHLRRERPQAPLDPLEETPEREAQPTPPPAPAQPAAPAAARAKSRKAPARKPK